MKLLDKSLIDGLLQRAAAAPRLRANHNLHPVLEDPVQRFFNALHPDTYIRPHRHLSPPRWELFMVLTGQVVLLVFDDDGCVASRQVLSAEGPVFGVELAPGRWHALAALMPSVMFELKEGPYNALSDKDFAQWAPAENRPGCEYIVRWYTHAQVGERFTG